MKPDPEADLQARVELLRSPSTSATGGREVESPPTASPALSPHGYNDIAIATQATRAIAEIGSQVPPNGDDYIHPDLRTRNHAAPAPAPTAMMSASAPAPTAVPVPVTGPAPVPQPQQMPTVAMAMAGMAPLAASMPGSLPAQLQAVPPLSDMSADGRKTKRELSQSKRAAQNRAAQRAFRQRKEGYIKKLEQQVRDFIEMEQSYKQTQEEMKAYIIRLQSRLLELQGEFPQPPPNVLLAQNAPPHEPTQQPVMSEDEDHTMDQDPPASGTPLEAVAQAVASLTAQDQLQYVKTGKPEMAEDARTEDEINRQLMRADGLA